MLEPSCSRLRLRGGGCAGSKATLAARQPTLPRSKQAQVADHTAVALLVKLDERFEQALRSGAIKLLHADAVRALPELLRRQDLESRQCDEGIKIFLTSEEAVAALRAQDRSIASLTYGWTAPGHPDVSGTYLASVQRFLRSPLGAHIVGLFWDFCSLPQKPRSAAEDALFKEALACMGDVYASALGTMAIRHEDVPARHPSLDGWLVVLVAAGGDLDADTPLRMALGGGDAIERLEQTEAGQWQARFASHEAAEAAEAAGVAGAVAVFLKYNGRPYFERGWTNFESGVATEVLARAAFFKQLQMELAKLPPKLVEIDRSAPRAVEEVVASRDEGAGPRIARVRQRIDDATFTGKGDKPVVQQLYNQYIMKVNNSMAESGENVEGAYVGECNAADQPEGRGVYHYANGDVHEGQYEAGKAEGLGTMRWANGDVYEGEWRADKISGRGTWRFADGAVYEGELKAGKKDGRGTFHFANGDVYDGEYTADMMQGRGTYRHADGSVYDGQYRLHRMEGCGTYRFPNGMVLVARFEADAPVGEAAMWNPDGRKACRMQDGLQGEKISLEEAARIAAAVGAQVPVKSFCPVSGEL